MRQIWFLISSLFFSFTTATSNNSVFNLPRILSIDLNNDAGRMSILSLVNKTFSHPDLIPLDECSIVVTHSLIRKFNEEDFYNPKHLFFRIIVVCAGLGGTRHCLASHTDWDSNTFFLEKLSGSLLECPRGSMLLSIHEDIGRIIGASVSRLQDASLLSFFREAKSPDMAMRSILLFSILRSSPHPTSYYSAYGYLVESESTSMVSCRLANA